MPTADAVAAVSAIPRPRAGALDETAAAANGLRVTTLMELESWCSDDWPEHEYWRCVVMAAAAKLRGIKTLRCDIVDCDADVARRLVYLENAKRKDLDQLEKAESIRNLWDEYRLTGRTQDELARDLGIAQSTISNTIRLLQLVPELQTMLRDGELSLDQARALARWGHRPNVQERFLKLRKDMGLDEGPIEKNHFDRWLERAIEAASRPMKKITGWSPGPSCEFQPTKEQEEQLDIEKAKIGYGGEQRRAFNINLWQKLNREAKERKAEKEKTAKPTQNKPSKSNADETYRLNRQAESLRRSWNMATAAAIADRFSGKVKTADRSLIHRVATVIAGPHLCGISNVEAPWGMDDLKLSDEAWAKRCQDQLNAFFDEEGNWDELRDDELAALATVLQVSPDRFFKPSQCLIATLTTDEVRDFAEQQGLSGDEAELRQKLPDEWLAGWVPDLFCRTKPKKARKGAK